MIHFQGRYCGGGRCYNDSDHFRLTHNSRVYVDIYYGDRSIIGWTLNFRYRFDGDADHAAATSDWVKTRVTR